MKLRRLHYYLLLVLSCPPKKDRVCCRSHPRTARPTLANYIELANWLSGRF
jgi:hypothetical protein